MKTTRNATLLLLVIALLFSNAFAATMYAPDGRTIIVDNDSIYSYEQVGWYTYPVVMMYAPDGRSTVVNETSVAEWERVGWIDARKTTMVYTADGRRAMIPLWQLQAYQEVGWYDYPVATMYAPDGRSIVVNELSVSSWESVGWIDGSKTTTVYAADGRRAKVPLWQLQAYKNVGWNDHPDTSICYPGTELPKYDFVTGDKCSYKNYSGTAYEYYSNDISMPDKYLSYIRTYYDWVIYNTGGGRYSTEYYLYKNNSHIKIYYDYLSRKVEISILN